MIGRLAHVTIAACLCLAFLGTSGTGCYDLPQPACGFVCGPAGACPADYTCNAADNRCWLDGTPPGVVCPALDGGIDLEDFPPFVIQQFPSPGAFAVPINVTPTVTFSEPVTGVSEVTFTLRELGNSTSIPASVSYNVATRTASLDPDLLLEPSTTYTVSLNSLTSAITDLTGNSLDFPLSWNFTTMDMTPPMVTGMSPVSGATEVGVDTTISVTFSENVTNVTLTTFTVEDASTTITGSLAFSPVSPMVTFTPETQLSPNTVHLVRLTGEITDSSGNPLDEAPVFWSFTTGADSIPPEIADRTPGVSDTDVSPTASVAVFFTEGVVGVSAASVLLDQGGTPVPGTVTYTASTRIARLVPDAPLASSTTYTVTLTAAITDASSNPLADAPVSWSFTTGEEETPSVTMALPVAGATGVAVDTTVSAVFSEPVLGVSAATFTVEQVGTPGTPVTGGVTYTAQTQTATFSPDAQLAPNTMYRATLTNAIQDLNGNTLAGAPVSWTFTTGVDTAAPGVVSTTPTADATGIPAGATITVEFDEPVQNVTATTFTLASGGAIAGTLASALGGRSWTFTPDAALPAPATITVTLATAITDVAGNPLAAPVMFSFMTLP